MRYACLLLLLLSGCETAAAIDRADIIAALAVRYGALSVRDSAPQPTPDVPSEGCVDGCRCNGTGREKTGDGLSEVDCRCPPNCDCKPSQDETVIEEAATVQPDPPPLVKIPQATSSSNCASGRCAPMPAGMPQVMSSGNCANGSCGPQQVRSYSSTRFMPKSQMPQSMSTGSCANGSCSTQFRRNTTRRGLFRR